MTSPRLALAALLVALAPAAAAAGPDTPIKPPAKVDVLASVKAKLTPRVLTKDESASALTSSKLPERVKVAAKRLDPAQVAAILQLPDPNALPPARTFDARTLWRDDKTFVELESNRGGVYLRTDRNYVYFLGGETAPAYSRPRAVLHFEALPATRYVLECAVDGGPGTTFTAGDGRVEYAVRADDKATLVYILDHTAATATPVVVSIGADTAMWYLDGCRLTASRP